MSAYRIHGISMTICRSLPGRCLVVMVCAGIAADPLAAAVAVQAPSADEFANAKGGEGPFTFVDNISRDNYLLGDMWGLRPWLARGGVTFGLSETSEVLGNVTGGTREGFEYDGLTQAVIQVDTQRALGWNGGTFNVSALQLHGRNVSADNLDSLQTASGIESDRSTRLWELWFQQKFLDEDRVDVKVGQQSLDQEFMVSQNANYFVNTMFGWPMLPSADLPGGGPAYPLSDLGIRVRAKPTDSITILAGLFNGSPVKNDNGTDPQRQDARGTSFPLNGGALLIAEIQYAYPALGAMENAGESEPLSCVYKLGVWYDSETFADERTDDHGLALADPASDGTPATHRGDYAIYATGDQMIWHAADDSDRNINLFARVMDAPEASRNLISFSMNFGVVMHEPFRHRDDDTFGIGMGWTKVSNAVAGAEEDAVNYSGVAGPIQHSETYIEATYQYEVAPWWILQPDVQYVFHPGGGETDPNGNGRIIRNETVLGLRTNILF